jgi:tetratricopeptide (TPR) repeat protein
MIGFRKLQVACALAASAWLAPAWADDPASEAKLDALFVELREPGREDWERVEAEIGKLWLRSGSPAMDLLLRRGKEAIEAEDLPAALEHFGALTDHAPAFPEGWHARASTFFMMGEYSLAVADLGHVLALEPRHFEALSLLGTMFEQMDEPELALRAFEQVQELSPNRPSARDAVMRLRRLSGDVEL